MKIKNIIFSRLIVAAFLILSGLGSAWAQASGYKVIINGDDNYQVSADANILKGTTSVTVGNNGYLDLTDAIVQNWYSDNRNIRINCTDKFVWGPVLDRSAKTITYTIKTPVDVTASTNTPITTEGWYQFQIVDYNGKNTISTVNGYTAHKSNNIYLTNADIVHRQNGSNWYSVKYSGITKENSEAQTFFYLHPSANNPRVQASNGLYVKDNGCTSLSAENYTPLTAISNALGGIYSVKRWTVWGDNSQNANERPYMGASGSNINFHVRAVKVNPTEMYDVYRVDIPGVSNTGELGNYAHVKCNNEKLAGANIAYQGGYFFFAKGSTLTAADFTCNVSSINDNMKIVISKSDANGIRTITFKETDPLATEPWTINVVNGDYSVTYNGDEVQNGGELLVRPGTTPKPILLTIDAPADKFVWGPIIDNKEKTVTYEVCDLVSSLPTGWYQLQFANDANYIAGLTAKIKTDEGNVNTKANTLYLAPTIFEAGGNKFFKATGVPTYADKTATFVYIESNSATNYKLYNTRTGESVSGTFTFVDGKLTKSSGWVMEPTPNPVEGPFLIHNASQSESMVFNVAEADMTKYDIYKVVINGADNVRVDVKNNDICGNNTVGNGGYLLLTAGSNAPLRQQISVSSGNATVNTMSISAVENGVATITINVSARSSYWRAKITGDKRDTDRVVYNNKEFVDDALMPLPLDAVPAAITFSTNVTDRFVWGPIIDNVTKTVTFDIRPLPAEITTGWYQIQLLGDSKIADANYRIANNTGNINTRSNYIYVLPMYNNTNDILGKFGGIPSYAGEPSTYFHITRSGSNISIQSPDGRYTRNDGATEYGQASQSYVSAWQYSDNRFKVNSWTAPGYWQTPGNSTNMGGNAGNQGPVIATGGGYLEEHFVTKVNVEEKYDVYQVQLPSTVSKVKYIGSDNQGMSLAYNNGYFFLPKGSVEPIASDFKLVDSEGVISSIAISGSGTKTIAFTVNIPEYNREIIHRQAYFYDDLDEDSNRPGAGFIQKGEGMNSREGTNGTIREQNMALYEVPIYMKQGTTFTSYLPTNQVSRYQRWYDYDTDSQVSTSVLTSLAGWNVSANNTYTNGHLTGGGYGGYRNDPQFSLPLGVEEYNVGLDLAHCQIRGTVGSGSTQSIIEPTLSMRVVYQLRDAKQIARQIKQKTKAGEFFEVHEISFPNIKHGNLDDKTLSSLMPLDMDLNNYWIFDGNGEDDADLVQLLTSGGAQLEVELAQYSQGAQLKNVMMIPANASAASGNIKYSTFNTGHFVLFQYPDGGVVPANSTATVNVYIKKNESSQRYNLAQFHLTFIDNAEPVVVTELTNTFRHPDNLQEEYGLPVAELSFDNKTNNEYGSWYKYPLDFKGVSYAFGSMVQGGGHTNYFASRGEYGLTSESTTSKALGGGSYTYYPVTNYLRNMRQTNAAFTDKESDNYFLYIDAADQPGKVASIELEDALCAGSRLYCYGYIGCTSGGTDQNPTSVLINVMGTDKNTGREELIYSYCPGIITLRGYDNTGRQIYATPLGRGTSYEPNGSNANYWAPWQQIGFSFTVSADVAQRMRSYSVQIVNNAYNSEGADTVLDDFSIYVKKPGAEVQNTTPLCSDQIRHIKVIAEYDALIEAAGDDKNHDGMINVGFCFLDKEIYDQALLDYAGNVGLHRNDPENTYNKAFGLALMGRRTINKETDDHAFHNFNIIRDGEVSDAYGETRVHYYEDIPVYSFKESGDDTVYRDSIRNERYIVFKESIAYNNEESGHKWVAGKDYYLLFSTSAITEDHVNNHDLACTVFNLDDNRCAVLREFTVAPPVSIKGDAESITSGDEVQACAGQTATLTVNLNGRTDTKDVVIKNLNYDWWLGYVSNSEMEMENGVPKMDENGNPIYIGNMHTANYNTIPATMQNYMNVWWGKYKNGHKHLDKQPGDRIYLSDAMLEFRRAYPDAVSLDGVTPKHAVGDTEEYELTQEMIDCIAHFLQTEPESGRTPLVLMKKEMNLSLGIDVADKDKVVHFVVIPIAPGIYSVDEDAIYCPDPQELKVKLLNEAPSIANGFVNKAYPESMNNVPMRVGLQQINGVRVAANGQQKTLKVPLRKVSFAYPEVGQRLVKSIDPIIYIVGTDDPSYKQVGNRARDMFGNFQPDEEDIDEMFIEAGYVDMLDIDKNDNDPFMKIVFDNGIRFREGYTYTLKVKYMEVMSDNERDKACEGSFVFDMKIVPEYQMWAGKNSDWTNDKNWRRADADELYAQNAKAEDAQRVINGATPLHGYITNDANDTSNSFVPMYFTNVVMDSEAESMPQLYEANTIGSDGFIVLPATNADPSIRYDMCVKPIRNSQNMLTGDYDCELFGTNICRGINFKPASHLMNAHLLQYDRAWVEYKLETDRWYTLSSPLQDTYAGEWYAPTGTTEDNVAKQQSPYFYSINWGEALNDRFRPAFYQRSWDSQGNLNNVYLKDGSDCNAYIANDWSYVYNDVLTPYEAGGFSVKVSTEYSQVDPADGYALVRMPKDDTKYTYFDIDGATGSKGDDTLPELSDRYRLWSDRQEFTQQITNAVETNNFFLVGNPYMANLNMDEFFAQNPQLEKTYWIMTEGSQTISVRAAYDDRNSTTSAVDERWTLTRPDGDFVADSAVVAPLQGFFVKTKAVTNTTQIKYTLSMQTTHEPELRSRAMNFPDTDPGFDGDEDEPTPTPQDVYSISGMKLGTTDTLQTTRPCTTIVVMKGKKVAVGE